MNQKDRRLNEIVPVGLWLDRCDSEGTRLDLLTEAVRVVLGVSLGTLSVYFAVATFRAWYTGSDAYEANRAATPHSIKSIVVGQKGKQANDRNRNSFGLAIELGSGKLVSQQRLSKEAVDDVIGRRF